MGRIRALALSLATSALTVGAAACSGENASRYRRAAGESGSATQLTTAASPAPAPQMSRSAPIAATPITRPMTFRFDVGDEVAFTVWKEPELTTQQRILRDGTISPPLLRAMPVVGLSLDELQGRLEASYTEYLKEPKVSVKVVTIRSDRVFVLGEVRTPQAVSVIGPTTVLESVTQAGGFQMEFADRQRVHWIHKGPDGQPQLTLVNLDCALTGGGGDPRIEPGDIVYVPPQGVTNWSRVVGQALAPITGALSSASSVAALVIAAKN